MSGLIGKKIGMTSIFDKNGKNIPCTVLEVGPCVVTQVKTIAGDGYNAIQLGFNEKSEKRATNAVIGHFKKARPVTSMGNPSSAAPANSRAYPTGFLSIWVMDNSPSRQNHLDSPAQWAKDSSPWRPTSTMTCNPNSTWAMTCHPTCCTHVVALRSCCKTAILHQHPFWKSPPPPVLLSTTRAMWRRRWELPAEILTAMAGATCS